VVLDFSVQADASVALLGGIKAPTKFTPGIATRGAEVVASVPVHSTAVGFISSMRAYHAAQISLAAPPVNWWRGAALVPLTVPSAPFDWRSCTVNIGETCGHGPTNLFVAVGGSKLHDLFQLTESVAVATALRSCVGTVTDTIFIIDTDAELSERCTSLLGLAAADELVVITSASWQDTQRLITDPVNSLFTRLAAIHGQFGGFVAKVSTVCFNAVAKASKDPLPPLPFTPPAVTVSMIREIGGYMSGLEACKPFLAPHTTFYDEIVTAVATIPDGTKMKTLETGIPIVMFAKTEADVTAANNIRSLASRISF
jgi:hypothetical protein